MGERSEDGRTLTFGGVGDGSDDHLRGRTLGEYFEGTEEPRFVLTNEKKGIKHEDNDGEQVVTPADDCRAVAAATDERVLLVIGGNTDGSGRNRSVSLPYTEIRSVESSSGVFKSRLSITARTSDTYHFFLGGREDLEAETAYIERAISHWVSVERRLATARENLSTIESHIESGDPDAAVDAVRETDQLLDEARQVASDFKSGMHAMHRRIAQLDTRLDLAEIRSHWTRGRQLAGGGQAARRDGDYEHAFECFRAAETEYERAIEMASESEYHKVADMESEAGGIDEALSALASEPLERAETACEAAVDADDLRDAVDAWKGALNTTHDALSLSHRYDDGFDGDVDELRFQVEWAVQNLLRAHRNLVDRAEAVGENYEENGDEDSARRAYALGVRNLREARAVASEFRSGSPGEFDDDIARLERKHASVVGDDGADANRHRA